MRVNGVLSNKRHATTHGWVFSPLLYILHTKSRQSQFKNGLIIKSSDDAVIVGLLKRGELDQGSVLNKFVSSFLLSFELNSS